MELFDVLLVGAFDALLLGEPQIYISSASRFPPSRFLLYYDHAGTRGAAHTTIFLYEAYQSYYYLLCAIMSFWTTCIQGLLLYAR